MKTIKNLFEKINDFENLYLAWESARQGKRYREEIMAFSDNLESNPIDIQNHLIYGTYKVGRYHPFYIYEPKKCLITRTAMIIAFCEAVKEAGYTAIH